MKIKLNHIPLLLLVSIAPSCSQLQQSPNTSAHVTSAQPSSKSNKSKPAFSTGKFLASLLTASAVLLNGGQALPNTTAQSLFPTVAPSYSPTQSPLSTLLPNASAGSLSASSTTNDPDIYLSTGQFDALSTSSATNLSADFNTSFAYNTTTRNCTGQAQATTDSRAKSDTTTLHVLWAIGASVFGGITFYLGDSIRRKKALAFLRCKRLVEEEVLDAKRTKHNKAFNEKKQEHLEKYIEMEWRDKVSLEKKEQESEMELGSEQKFVVIPVSTDDTTANTDFVRASPKHTRQQSQASQHISTISWQQHEKDKKDKKSKKDKKKKKKQQREHKSESSSDEQVLGDIALDYNSQTKGQIGEHQNVASGLSSMIDRSAPSGQRKKKAANNLIIAPPALPNNSGNNTGASGGANTWAM